MFSLIKRKLAAIYQHYTLLDPHMKALLLFLLPLLCALAFARALSGEPSQLLSRTSPSNSSECANPPYNNCSFYAVCLESQYHCGPNGYPIGYGQYYCTKFQNESYLLSPKGQTWMVDTMHCLQTTLVPIALDEVPNTTCTSLENTAFSSHAPCYVENGLCTLEPSDWFAIFEIVGVGALISSWDAFKATIEAAGDCVGFYAWMVEQALF